MTIAAARCDGIQRPCRRPAEHLKFRLWHAPDAPFDFFLAPGAPGVPVRVLRVLARPQLTVSPELVPLAARQASALSDRETRAPSRARRASASRSSGRECRARQGKVATDLSPQPSPPGALRRSGRRRKGRASPRQESDRRLCYEASCPSRFSGLCRRPRDAEFFAANSSLFGLIRHAGTRCSRRCLRWRCCRPQTRRRQNCGRRLRWRCCRPLRPRWQHCRRR